MALLQERKKFGVIDRMLVAFQSKIDGPLSSGPLSTKWADPTHIKSTETCVIDSAATTEFCFKGKCCYLTFTLVACQSNTAAGDSVTYEVFGSNDGFATEESLGGIIVHGDDEQYMPFNNEATVAGVKEYMKDIRIEATVNGGPVDAYVFLTRGMC